MNENEKIVAKGLVFAMAAKRYNHLTKAYLCLAGAGVYGIRAAREANVRADEALEKLDTEHQRPVIVVDPQ